MNWMANYIQLAWKLVCMLRTYKTCNPMVRFSKYELNKKLLSGIKLFRVIPSLTIYIYIYIKTQSWLCIWMCLSIVWIISSVIL